MMTDLPITVDCGMTSSAHHTMLLHSHLSPSEQVPVVSRLQVMPIV